VTIPDWSARLARLSFDRKHLADYNALCGFTRSDVVPMTYPQALATPLFLHLMTQPGFPLPLMGLVHVRNAVEQRREISVDETLDMQIRLAGSREVRTGLEIDLTIELTEANADVLWRATMTVLRRGKKVESGGAKAEPVESPLAQYLRFDAPEDIGRRYARISQDYNPIHLYASTAKLFGFPRAIAHGLWSAARSLALLEGRLAVTPRIYDIQFRQPLLLPGRATLRLNEEASRIDFALLDARGGKVHLTGTLR
jgi:acyl dehydratase